MELYLHHVGQAGSDEDFPKTVFADVDLARIEAALPPDDPTRDEIVRTLRARFPGGACNCWGVPIGARWPIAHLGHGDAVLLVESVSGDGSVPALCPDVRYWNRAYHQVSEELWGNPRYPYVFYFRTEPLDLTWREMCADLGYRFNWSPRNFFRIPVERVEPFGGPEGYLRRLRERHGRTPASLAPVDAADLARLGEEADLSAEGVNRELAVLAARLARPPELTEGLDPEVRQVVARPRSAAFRVAVKRLYGERCAVCGSGLRGPDGTPEVEAAHIFPKALDGSDDPRNGLCLCRRHHWAFDAGWMAVADDRTVLVRPDLPHGDDYAFIRECAGRSLLPPGDARWVPAPLYLGHHRAAHRFEPER